MSDPNAAQPGSAPQATGRGLKIAFAISLTLNLLVIGLVAGAFLRGGPPGHGQPRDLSFGPFSAALSPEDRRALRVELAKDWRKFRADRQAAQEEFATLLAAMRADPYDPANVSQALSAVVARTADRLALGQSLLETRIAAMSAADRLAFADRLEAALRHR